MFLTKMIMYFYIILIITFISIFLVNTNFFLNKFSSKMEVECGIFNFSNKSINSTSYLLFLVIFLIFDLELVLMIPQIINNLNSMMMLFIIILVFSLLMEVFEVNLKWND